MRVVMMMLMMMRNTLIMMNCEQRVVRVVGWYYFMPTVKL
jgi:hypothetical protein